MNDGLYRRIEEGSGGSVGIEIDDVVLRFLVEELGWIALGGVEVGGEAGEVHFVGGVAALELDSGGAEMVWC